MAGKVPREVEERIAEAAAGLGLEAVEVEAAPGLLRVVVDAPGGVTVEDCARASRAIGPLLDGVPGLGNLSLEVSSPGLDRRLRLPRDLSVGARVRIERTAKVDGRRRYVGRVTAFCESALTVEVDGAGGFTIPYGEIAVARLAPVF